MRLRSPERQTEPPREPHIGDNRAPLNDNPYPADQAGEARGQPGAVTSIMGSLLS